MGCLSFRRRCTAILMLVTLAMASTLQSNLRAQDRQTSRVRAADPRIEALIADGQRRSRTVRLLLRRLDRLTTVVYIGSGILPARLTGQLRLMASVEEWRYVQIVIECRQPADLQIAALGHELQHAVEVAEAETVDSDSMQMLYRRIGFSTDGTRRRFETDAAREAGARVRRELANPASRLAAR